MTLAQRTRRRSCARRIQLGFSCFASATLAMLLAPTPAQACSFRPVSVGASYPRYDQHDVPTNAVLFVDGPAIGAQNVWLRDGSDHRVPIEVRAVEASGFDIEPLEPLAPSSSYVLRVTQPQGTPTTIPFTTGSGPAAIPSVLLTPEWAPVRITYDEGTCRDLLGYCTGAVGQPGTMLEVRSGPTVLSHGGTAPLSGWSDDRRQAGDCLSVRARDIRGNRSEPAIACDHDIGELDLRETFAPNATQPPDCEAITGVPGAAPARDIVPNWEQEANHRNSSGCVLHGRPTSTGGWLALGAALAALSRRRARPCPSP